MNLDKIKKIIPDTPGIILENTYRKASVLIPIIEIDGKLHLLFEVRSRNIKQGSEVCFPGGKFDNAKDTTTEDTAIRETIEELGISRDKISMLGQYNTMVHHMGMIITTYVAHLNICSVEELNIDKNEVSSVFTLPIDYFRKNSPLKYKLRLEAKPEIIDEGGNKKVLLPVKELGLPDKYLNPWGSNNHNVLVYPTKPEILWGMTAKITYDFTENINKLDL